MNYKCTDCNVLISIGSSTAATVYTGECEHNILIRVVEGVRIPEYLSDDTTTDNYFETSDFTTGDGSSSTDSVVDAAYDKILEESIDRACAITLREHEEECKRVEEIQDFYIHSINNPSPGVPGASEYLTDDEYSTDEGLTSDESDG